MSDSRESTREDVSHAAGAAGDSSESAKEAAVRATHVDGMHEALRILNWLRVACLSTAGPDHPRLLGLGLADYAIRAALRAKGGAVADDRVRRRRAKIEAERRAYAFAQREMPSPAAANDAC
jgi:hypothetical protein